MISRSCSLRLRKAWARGLAGGGGAFSSIDRDQLMSVEVSTREQSERERERVSEKENECGGGVGWGDCVIPTPRPPKDEREVVNSSSWPRES